jgi:DNA-binding LytR/AlgR family response regulator
MDKNPISFNEEMDKVGVLVNSYSDKALIVTTDENEMRLLPFQDILYVSSIKKELHEIRTSNESIKYYFSYDIIEYLEELEQEEFKAINSGVVINMQKIKAYEEYTKKVFFNESDLSVFVYATNKTINHIVSRLGKSKNLSNESVLKEILSYSPNNSRKRSLS